MPRKKAEGIDALVDDEPVSIQDITMRDWYAGFAIIGLLASGSTGRVIEAAFDLADDDMLERKGMSRG